MRLDLFLSLALTASAVAGAERPTIPILDAPTLTAACNQAIADAKVAYARLEALPVEQANVASVLDAWDDTYIALEDVSGPVATLVNVHPDPKVRDAGRACRAKISSFLGEVHQSDKLFERVKAVKTTNAVERELQNDIIASFEDSGVTLPKGKRTRAKEISDRITALAQEYNKNIRDNNTKLTFTPVEYEGMPQSYIDRVKKPDGTIEVSLDNPDYFPFMASSRNNEARKRYYIAFYRRGGARNLAILEEVVKLRKELASLHGARSFAHYALARRMAGTPETVHAFLDDVATSMAEVEKRNLDELRKLKAETLGTPLAETTLTRWDVDYWRERYNQRHFNLDQESTRKYFPPEATLAWLIDVTERVYTLKFNKSHAPLWHPDVLVYDVKDASTEALIGTVYLDLYPREGKLKTASSFSPRSGSTRTGRTPISVVGANFDRKGLTFGSVGVFFHEFGHAMHDILSETTYASNAGMSTETDFVEAPSQIYEEWARRPQTLALLAAHCSGCPEMDSKIIQALLDARSFGAVFFNSMNHEWARLDMALAGEAPGKPMEHWQKIEGGSRLGHVPGSEMPGIFHHILGGYAAGYYGYIWAEVIGKDMLAAWGNDLLDASVGTRFRKMILARGGEEPAKRMVERFLGRPMSSKAYVDELKGVPK
jgi:thimet oligopeptidase